MVPWCDVELLMAATVPDQAPMSLSSVTIYQASLISSGQSSCWLLIITIVISVLSPTLWPVPPAWGLVSGVWGRTGRAGPLSGAGPGLPGRQEERSQWSADTGPVQTWHPELRTHHGSSVTSGRDYKLSGDIKQEAGTTHEYCPGANTRSEWGRVTAIWSSGAAFISSAPAWHTPPTQVSLGHQWNYLNVPRENILSAWKSEYDLIAAEGSRDKRPCSLSPSDCYGENFKSVRMPLITLQLYCSLIANFQDRIPQKSRKLLFTLAVYRW